MCVRESVRVREVQGRFLGRKSGAFLVGEAHFSAPFSCTLGKTLETFWVTSKAGLPTMIFVKGPAIRTCSYFGLGKWGSSIF